MTNKHVAKAIVLLNEIIKGTHTESQTIIDAIRFASVAHGDQQYGGLPYIVHPVAVMLALPNDATTDMKIAAILHDVLEDTDVSETEIETRFNASVLRMVKQLTRDKDAGTYQDWILEMAKIRDIDAIKVKIADITVNITDCKETLTHRYEHAMDVLTKVVSGEWKVA